MDPYLLFKCLHLLGLVVFGGNIVVTAWWKTMADRTRDPRVIAFAQRQVTLTDWVFTLGGAVLLVVGGFGAAGVGHLDMAAPWLRTGEILFGVSGLIWIAGLVPIQVRQARLARGFAAGGEIPVAYWRLGRLWYALGAPATILPLAAVVVMVAR
ncbi:DUF2269 family protein [Zavarzinia sp.]|uniref:DUF2269 family protein n=1 Tax=Zavarzinia sp. TaxID=2027920 RepID=UPI003567F291